MNRKYRVTERGYFAVCTWIDIKHHLLMYPWHPLHGITCERVPGSRPPYISSSSHWRRAWEQAR